MIRRSCFYCGILAAVLLTFTRCSSVYMPNVPATPMFKQQGEGYVAAHANLKGNLSGTAGIAVTEHIAILGNGSFVDYGRNSSHHFKQWSTEGALGYFTTIGPGKRQVLELYAGYGVGHTEDIDLRSSTVGYEPVESRVLDFDKIFVQVNYSATRKQKLRLFGRNRVLNYGTAVRLSRVGMKNFSINEITADKENNFYVEPLFFTRMELFKGFQLQYTNGFNIGMVSNTYLKAGNAVFTLGLVYNFN